MSTYTAWSTTELAAELEDVTAHIQFTLAELETVTAHHAEQVARTVAHYGHRHLWPCDSVHYCQQIEARQTALAASLAELEQYRAELATELAYRPTT